MGGPPLAHPAHDLEGRGRRPTGERPLHPDVAPHGQRHVLGELVDGELGPEVVGHRVEAARMDQPGSGRHRPGLVPQVGEVGELGLAGEVEVVGAGVGARRHHRIAVHDVGTHGGDEHPAPGRHGRQSGPVGGVHDDRLEPASRAGHHVVDLGGGAAGHGHGHGGRCVGGQVLGDQAAGESRGSQQHDVEVPGLGGHGRMLPTVPGGHIDAARGGSTGGDVLHQFVAVLLELADAGLHHVADADDAGQPSVDHHRARGGSAPRS